MVRKRFHFVCVTFARASSRHERDCAFAGSASASADAGRVAIGAEARIILDAASKYVIPAKISYVADVAQFTPKTVETEIEREKLMFRVRARIAPELLARYLDQIKTGLPGVAWVRLDPTAPWPAAAQGKVLE